MPCGTWHHYRCGLMIKRCHISTSCHYLLYCWWVNRWLRDWGLELLTIKTENVISHVKLMYIESSIKCMRYLKKGMCDTNVEHLCYWHRIHRICVTYVDTSVDAMWYPWGMERIDYVYIFENECDTHAEGMCYPMSWIFLYCYHFLLYVATPNKY